MNLLLDTHAIIWVLEDNPKLSDVARSAIEDGGNTVFVSAVSVWEMSIKQAMGKLSVPNNLAEEIELLRFSQLDINFKHADLAGKLPNIHKDPFDRLLIAQAKIESLTLLSKDPWFDKYDVELKW